ncbi:ZYRO0F04136p [Zygosaccharomyces rouxii]|uniref:ATP-dependent DNA helicase CHL1 n=1 Tax=Zygosaccharomyces rouxii (strain ATCC 2623 / CBS 732 / NBRC 1130 / NCYC 568 / NRRL Y-229) TaxID=559307 RepID=C5DXD4_ZYGRC|nr:uncharacterized protein ZYRO0F04136g [Zygosaccharomyces rouxii]KAH9199208.1 hypothetical protein LQ764DRAFT_213898 [Zygosaccharomyces rouxii]CAR28445.1 ZYRO0F04136p [Zygosaccharomyces rouxii]
MSVTFNHPYDPYDIQLELMRCVYDALSHGKKLCIVESPTGTGKTLSLICSVLTWLRDNKADLLMGKDGEGQEDEDEDEPDWVNQSYVGSVLSDQIQLTQDYEAYLEQLRNKKIIVRDQELRDTKRRKLNRVDVKIDNNRDDEFLPQEYYSDDEEQGTDGVTLGREVKDMLAKLNGVAKNEQDKFDIDHLNPIKVYFASRTHSQLRQFASQLRLPIFPPSLPNVKNESIKHLPLGSRKQLCINPQVSRLKSTDAINDACKELQQNGKNGCKFKQNINNQLEQEFRDRSFTSIHDIEDLAALGQSLDICPYYASRDSLTSAEIITLPYQFLLFQSTRESLGLDLKNSVVVIDEAHNLIDTVNAIHSSEISLQDLQSVKTGLTNYLSKFKSRLGPGNRVNLMKLIKLIDVLIIFTRQNYKKPGQVIDPIEILSGNADTLNIHKINKYIKISKISYKIQSYMQSVEKDQGINNPGQPLLFKIASFITCLTYPTQEGKFFFEKGPSIKYMLLQPDKCFQSVLEDSRCVILAGGTMQPVSDVLENLFPTVSNNQLVNFSCDHVIPDDNLGTYVLQEPQIELTFEKREQPQVLRQMGEFYLQLSKAVPLTGGIVGFFPSYQYLQFVIDHWKKTGLWSQLTKLRKVNYETKSGEDPLPEYTEAVDKGEGAMLFAVVGGRLSEGINFQDNLCRAIVMTGLPFPNVFSGEMMVKRSHLENKILQKGGTRQDAMSATKLFFETICLKAVNQSVGRAIRHANDYANIYLLDKRYGNPHTQEKLSHWVSKRLQPQSDLDSIMDSTRRFFANKEEVK